MSRLIPEKRMDCRWSKLSLTELESDLIRRPPSLMLVDT